VHNLIILRIFAKKQKMSQSKTIQNVGISKLPFWDVDFKSLHPEYDCLFILEKVFNYGFYADRSKDPVMLKKTSWKQAKQEIEKAVQGYWKASKS
jgi:hypothetical protein